jgi:transposase-like protein
MYGAAVSREMVAKITDRILEDMNEWLNRPFERVYAALFTDAVVAKVRDGQATSRPPYTAIGVTACCTGPICSGPARSRARPPASC